MEREHGRVHQVDRRAEPVHARRVMAPYVAIEHGAVIECPPDIGVGAFVVEGGRLQQDRHTKDDEQRGDA